MNAMTWNRDCPLDELEWKVVETARNDGPRTIKPDGVLTKLLSSLFGISAPRQLANRRLEALRRFCVRAWYWDVVRIRDVRLLMDAGYSSTALFQILAHVASHRGFTPSIQEIAA